MSADSHLPPSHPARILIVDDQPANLQVLGSMLGRLGYEIVPAADGETALKRLALRPPDLVLLDLLMPGMDGFEVCRRIREQPAFSDLPIIFLSAADEKSLVVRALESGGVDYVAKPFNQAELIRRVQTQVLLKAARDRLRQLAEDKDEMLGILAHDLKNALGSILMSADVLVERTIGEPRLRRLSLNIHEATDRTLAFVNQFLANIAAEHGLPARRDPVDLRLLAAEVMRVHEPAAARKEQGLHLEAPASEVVILTDVGLLRQVLDNLLSNAVKFSRPGQAIRVAVRESAEAAECIVADEGPGFSAEDHLRMFRRYGRLSARPTGGEPSSGLGLSIVRRLVQTLGGDLRCESVPGAGATFTVRLSRS
jgi:two-component system sensor histidine kinase/response regulator